MGQLDLDHYLQAGDPLNYMGMLDDAHSLDSGWHELTDAYGEPDHEMMERAILNAIKAGALTSGQSLADGAAHYQKVLPVHSSNPIHYERALRNGDPMEAALMHHLPGADRYLFRWRHQEQAKHRRENPDADIPTIAAKADRSLEKRVKIFTKESMPKADKPRKFSSGEVGWSTDAIRNICHSKECLPGLLNAALEDISKGGSGYKFRRAAHEAGLPLGQASMAWFLLMPHASQLALLNPQILKFQGYHPSALKDHNYELLENQLREHRNGTGYEHAPLGLYSKGLWDHLMGAKSDLTPLKVR